MPHLTCPAGHDVDLSSMPNPQGYVVLREGVVEDVVDRLIDLCRDAGSRAIHAREAFAALSPRNPGITQLYECPVCRRLAWFERASDDVPSAWYRPERGSNDGP